MGRRNRGLRGILCGPRKNISLFWSLFLSLPLSAALSLSFCLSIFLIPCLPGKQQMFSSCYCPCLLFFFFLASLASQNVWGNREIYPKLSRSGGREVCGKGQTCSHHAPHHVSIPFLQNFQEHPVGMRHGQMKTHTHTYTQCNHLILKWRSPLSFAQIRNNNNNPIRSQTEKHIRKLLRHSSSSSAGLCSKRSQERTIANSNNHMFKRWENLPQNSNNLCRLRTKSCLQRILTVFLFFSGTSSKENLQWRWALADHHSLFKGFASLVEIWVGCCWQHPRDRDRR